MKIESAIRTSWTDALENNEEPCLNSLREHLLEVHRRHPGFTEGCATKCKDAAGRTSYEWLCDVIGPARHPRILDLACGGGFLLEQCHARYPDADALAGVDMSPAELALARTRLAGKDVALHEGLAQDLSFAETGSFDAVLCHWALTLMDPVEPVFREVERVLASGGVFAAIVDGDPAGSPGYAAINDLVFKYVRTELPTYGDQDLGDPRTRTPQTLAALVRSLFATADVSVETSIFSLSGVPEALAEEAAGFFYAAFILPTPVRARLLSELTALFEENAEDGTARFLMPVCRLIVRF